MYGTTEIGGRSFGNIFKITPRGALTTLYNFCSEVICADGAFPYAGLVIGTDGNFYGRTSGGANSACGNEGCGTVFRITPAGTLTTLHRFDQTDGAEPTTAMVQAADGDFYGTTPYGGKYNACKHGCGTIFKITAAGALTTLHNFTLYKGDGGYPSGGLVQATDGNFTGPLHRGGEKHGTIYKFAYRSGRGTLTTLHKFDGTDGTSAWRRAAPGHQRVVLWRFSVRRKRVQHLWLWYGFQLVCGAGAVRGDATSLWQGWPKRDNFGKRFDGHHRGHFQRHGSYVQGHREFRNQGHGTCRCDHRLCHGDDTQHDA